MLQYLGDLMEDAIDIWESAKASHPVLLCKIDQGRVTDTMHIDRIRRAHAQKHCFVDISKGGGGGGGSILKQGEVSLMNVKILNQPLHNSVFNDQCDDNQRLPLGKVSDMFKHSRRIVVRPRSFYNSMVNTKSCIALLARGSNWKRVHKLLSNTPWLLNGT